MLKDSLPQFVTSMKEMKSILQAEQIELNLLEDTLQEFMRQFYIKSATYELDRWESELGLEKNPGLTQEQRRGRLLAKLNTTTPASISMLENLVQQVLGADRVTIVEHPAEYKFDIYVNTKYIAANMGIAAQAVYEARPAHLQYGFINSLSRDSNQKLFAGFTGMIIKQFYGRLEEYRIERNRIQEVYNGFSNGIQKNFTGKVGEP